MNDSEPSEPTASTLVAPTVGLLIPEAVTPATEPSPETAAIEVVVTEAADAPTAAIAENPWTALNATAELQEAANEPRADAP
jgi:hypothetical protein